MTPSFKQVVETGYVRVADRYPATKDAKNPTMLGAVEHLPDAPPPDAAVLDLDCGAGVPVTRWLAQRFAVEHAEVRTTKGASGDESWLWSSPEGRYEIGGVRRAHHHNRGHSPRHPVPHLAGPLRV